MPAKKTAQTDAAPKFTAPDHDEKPLAERMKAAYLDESEVKPPCPDCPNHAAWGKDEPQEA